MTAQDTLLHTLRTWGRLPAAELTQRLGISRPTLARAVQALDAQVVGLGRARRRAYAARRPLRGRVQAVPMYVIDRDGRADEVGVLHPLYPQGTALEFLADFAWPLDPLMRDGWFEGLPYPLEDMRPQGFLGRNFARANAAVLQVSEDPRRWSEDDVLHVLSLLGADAPGAYVVGELALREWNARRQRDPDFISDRDLEHAYPALAAQAMANGVVGSSAGGEFPKFTGVRKIGRELVHVLVKFSGSDRSPGTQRWSDLLVCEHLAAATLREHLGIPASESTVHMTGGRTFLEVRRFDRHGSHGRSHVCSWSALNAGLFGLGAGGWPAAAKALSRAGLIKAQTQLEVEELWHFGQLIGNTDMHDGNLSFEPGLRLAPAYDMLPMMYAPERGVELPKRSFAPLMPLPGERSTWKLVMPAAQAFWETASRDTRISSGFRRACKENAAMLKSARSSF